MHLCNVDPIEHFIDRKTHTEPNSIYNFIFSLQVRQEWTKIFFSHEALFAFVVVDVMIV